MSLEVFLAIPAFRQESDRLLFRAAVLSLWLETTYQMFTLRFVTFLNLQL